MDLENITGIILAGGQGQRMGGVDKGQVKYRGTPMAQQVIDRLAPQVGKLILSANRNISAYESLGYPVIQDPEAHQYEGPIAGILTCLSEITTEYAVIVPCDAPLISENLVSQLIADNGQPQNKLTLFEVEGKLQPLFGLFHKSLVNELRDYFEKGNRKLVKWCESQSPSVIAFEGSPSAFSNINTREELKDLESKS